MLVVLFETDLAGGGSISAFKWNGGAEYKGKPWNESLPTDSAVCSCSLVCLVVFVNTAL